MEKGLPMSHGLGHSTAASLIAGAAAVLASVLGLVGGASRYALSQSVLVSLGADAANLIAVLVVLGALWLARRGSLTALLLWPGGLFYLAYAYLPYLVGAPFTPLLFADVVAFLAAAYGVAALMTGMDGTALRDRFQGAPDRAVGAFLTVIGVLAYAGLVAAAIGAFGSSGPEPAWRGHWVADWIVGTPALIAGGMLLWLRRPFGYAATPGLLLVSTLGGIIFAVAAVVDNLAGGMRTDVAVVVVHLVICAASLGVLVWFLIAARGGAPKIRRAGPSGARHGSKR